LDLVLRSLQVLGWSKITLHFT